MQPSVNKCSPPGMGKHWGGRERQREKTLFSALRYATWRLPCPYRLWSSRLPSLSSRLLNFRQGIPSNSHFQAHQGWGKPSLQSALLALQGQMNHLFASPSHGTGPIHRAIPQPGREAHLSDSDMKGNEQELLGDRCRRNRW